MPQKIAILGAGESGTGAAILARALGAQVWLSDAGAIAPSYLEALEARGIPYEAGGHSEARMLEADLVVKSPGIPHKAPIVQALKAAGKEIVSEIEFASRHTTAPIAAVTGTNGKTTTTSLLWHLLNQAGLKPGLGGNIGKSFAWMIAEDPQPMYVLEVSSFQLDDTRDFKPKAAVLLNITPDHLDRYHYDLRQYAAAKFRIAMKQEPEDLFIYNLEDPLTLQELPAHPTRAGLARFALQRQPEAAIWMEGHYIVSVEGWRTDYRSLQLKGQHNALNVMAAVLAARHMGAPAAALEAALKSFAPIEHRLEPVQAPAELSWINDSKATNVDAVVYALGSMTTPTVWIAGGIDKGNDYSALDVRCVKALVILGPHKDKLRAAYEGIIPAIAEADSMKAAVQTAAGLASPGDTVLLSPACASFDLFKNYEDRGRQFKAEVQALYAGQSTQIPFTPTP